MRRVMATSLRKEIVTASVVPQPPPKMRVQPPRPGQPLAGRDAEIIRLYCVEERSTVEIARMFGAKPDSVGGFLKRRGIKLRPPKRFKFDPDRDPAKKRAPSLPTERATADMKPSQPLDFWPGHDECSWLDGDPKERRFCCAPTVAHSTYCRHHLRRAYQVGSAHFPGYVVKQQ